MRCPHCGAENADNAPVCTSCGANLGGSDLLEDEVTKLIDQLPTTVARRGETAQLIGGQITSVSRDAALEGLPDPAVETKVAPTSEGDGDSGDDGAGDSAAGDTVLRPLPSQMGLPVDYGDRVVVRRTRDYDHDAQSTNLATASKSFETLREESEGHNDRRDPYARSSKKGEAPGEGNSRSKLRPLLAVLLVAVVLAGGGAILTYGMELWGGKSVPRVIGQSQAHAETALAGKGFNVAVEAEPADDAIGTVLSQSPDAGARVPEGSEVTIVIATNRTIPAVMGLSEEEARALLEAAGAERIDSVTKPSSEAEGTVVAVSPGEGEAFVSRATVTLTVATPFTVPDVIGKKESDAVDILKDAGFGTEVSYVVSDKTVRTVVETTPAAGEPIAEGGTVQVKVSSPFPTSPQHLAEFFSHSSQDVDTYLQKEGYAFDVGFVDTYGSAVSVYTSDDKGNVTFSSQPYTHAMSVPKEGSSNVLASGTPIAGVRFDFPSWQVPTSADQKAVEELAELCGFSGDAEYCSNGGVVLPAGIKETSATFSCASGTSGDLVWTVLVVGNNGSYRASATCAKQGLYNSAEVSTYGGSVCQFVAYQEVYLSKEYQKKDEDKKKEEGHDQADSADDSGLHD